MRLFTTLLLTGLMGRLGLACDEHTLLRGRELAGKAPAKGSKLAGPAVPIVHENRDSLDWTYIPNYDYKCEAVGCCGLPTAEDPKKQPCGPELWKYLNVNTSKRCISDGTTNQQTPIKIMTEGPEKMSFVPIIEKPGVGKDKDVEPVFANKKCSGKVTFTKNTWEVDFGVDCLLSVQLFGRKWHLVQFHFHNAEHTVNGIYMPLEVHMVHRAISNTTKNVNNITASDLTNDFLVLGAWLVPGAESAYFKALESTPGDEIVGGNATTETKKVDPYDIIPASRAYWHYEGSLTTPPCQVADGAKVQWILFQDTISLSLAQLGFFGSYFADIRKSYNGEVNRPIQPLNKNTKVYEYLGKGKVTPPKDDSVLPAKKLQENSKGKRV